MFSLSCTYVSQELWVGDYRFEEATDCVGLFVGDREGVIVSAPTVGALSFQRREEASTRVIREKLPDLYVAQVAHLFDGCSGVCGEYWPECGCQFWVRCEHCFLFFAPVHIGLCFVCGLVVCLSLSWFDVGCWVDEELHRDAVVLDFFAR